MAHKPVKKGIPANKLTVTACAVLLGRPYQQVRNMMLAGVFGVPEYEGNRLTVLRVAVLEWKQAQLRAPSR